MPAGVTDYDLIVIGSGPGGGMAAHAAVAAGKRVLMIERGDWVPRGPDNWRATGSGELTPHYWREPAYRVLEGGYGNTVGSYACVGGASVFYGCVAFRLRESDFARAPEIEGESGAAWPFTYADLEPYYTRAEHLLGVAGESGVDPTEPPRSAPFPQTPAPLAPISARLAGAARDLGLTPFRLPMAINQLERPGRGACVGCGTCDSFACAVSAKNDVATAVVPDLVARGMTLVVNTVVVELAHDGKRITEVRCVERASGAPRAFRARAVIVAAGALATPHLLLASALERLNPAGDAVGRYLMRHCNSAVMGLFTKRPAPDGEFHKQLCINDYYLGHPDVSAPSGKLGSIQQISPLPAPVVRHFLGFLGTLVSPFVARTTGLLAMAEDAPQPENRVALGAGKDAFGMRSATVVHRYGERDLAARRALVRAAKRVLYRTGAVTTLAHAIKTFSHAVGTVRMGEDPARAPLDGFGAFRGVDNLYVADGSCLPRSGGVNPSLTIAANALRVGERAAAAL